MDDVIFAGTATRSARNTATVELLVENPDRDAPAPYNDGQPLRVSRHIERGAGSSFRINEKEVRARDQQLLFADASSGARSTAIVSQGQVGAIINAKPNQRRHLLEEAAGITGLHSRRHEAELRLNAAEGNIERLDDLLIALRGQLQALKKQSRQASRYRSLSGRIRKAEAMLLYRRWAAADSEAGDAEQQLKIVSTELSAEAARVAAAPTDQTNAAAMLPGLRAKEAEAASHVHRLSVAGERLDEESVRLEQELATLSSQLQVVLSDKEREEKLHGESATRLAELTVESEELRNRDREEEHLPEEAKEAVDSQRGMVAAKEAMVAALTEQLAAASMVRNNLEQAVTKLNEQLGDLEEKKISLSQEQAEIEKRADGQDMERERVEFSAMQNKGVALRQNHATASKDRRSAGDLVAKKKRISPG